MTRFQPIRSWLFFRSRSSRRNLLRPYGQYLALESLEPRMMLTADLVAATSDSLLSPTPRTDDIHVLFGPGTSAEYMAQVERARQQSGVGDVVGSGNGATAGQRGTLSAGATDLGTYQASQRWNNTTTDGTGLSWGDATDITWSIVPDGTPIPGYVGEPAGVSNFMSFMSDIYDSAVGSLTEQAWFSTIASVFDRWSDISGLNFVYEPHDDGAALSNIASTAPGVDGVRGDIRIGGHAIDGTSGTLAYNFFPDNGEMILDTSDSLFFDTANQSLRLRNVMAHEIGHGIGLSHVEPVDGTKLMEPIATTAFDGPQHDDILAAHRLYGDEFEQGAGNDRFADAVNLGALDGRRVTIGDNRAQQYVSIDGTTDVDYFRFTADAGAQFDARLIPLGYTYQQGAVGATTSNFQSQAQNDLAVSIYDVNHRLVRRVDSSGLGKSETLTDVTLAKGGQYFVEIRGTRDKAQLYQLDLTVSAGVPDDALDFRAYTVDSYGGLQDHSGSVVIENGGAALHLTGNRWTMIDFPYTVTPNTVLEFDFASTAEGDVHGIGFDSNTSISSGLTFRLHGKQDWGRNDFAVYDAARGVQHFLIPVGQSYTGQATALVFVNDHDVASPNAESVFSNVRIYESDRGSPSVAAPRARNDHIILNEDSPTVAVAPLANDDSGGTRLSITAVSAGSAGGSVNVAADGRVHYRPAADFNGTETFTYTAANAGGSSTATVTVTVRPTNDPPTAGDNRYAVTAGHTYRLNVLNNDSTGVDAGEALTIVRVGKGSANGKIVTDGSRITYTPATGFIGEETFTYTINDGTANSNATATVSVRVQAPQSDYLNFRDYRVDAYGGSQDVVGTALVEDSGRALRLLGNAWKRIDLPYTITSDTMLEFDFSSTSQGDIHGIGFDSNNTITSSRTIRLYGRQNWGIDAFATYTSNSQTKHYLIPIGKYYTGRVAYLFFVNDHDVRSPAAESLFRNLRLYEASNNTASSADSAPDTTLAASLPRSPFFDAPDSTLGGRRVGGEATARSISTLLETTTFTGPPVDVSAHASAAFVDRIASTTGGSTGPLSALQNSFGLHSLDRDTLTALDQIFAALGDAA